VTVGRVSQTAVEVVLQSVPKSRVGQQAAEILLVSTSKVRFGQQVIEVLRTVAVASGDLTRSPVLILCSAD
jgi:hypothetical protein